MTKNGFPKCYTLQGKLPAHLLDTVIRQWAEEEPLPEKRLWIMQLDSIRVLVHHKREEPPDRPLGS